jgi:6-pyruvoyl tetrahydropterin synthase/QueD family protein
MTENWINVDIRTEVTISAAHFVQTTKSQCQNLHGHNWRIEIEMSGPIQPDGMVKDFIEIKKIINRLDHKFLIPSQTYEIVASQYKSSMVQVMYRNNPEIMPVCIIPFSWVCLVDVPIITAEYLAVYLQNELKKDSPDSLIKIKVWESDKSCASV